MVVSHRARSKGEIRMVKMAPGKKTGGREKKTNREVCLTYQVDRVFFC